MLSTFFSSSIEIVTQLSLRSFMQQASREHVSCVIHLQIDLIVFTAWIVTIIIYKSYHEILIVFFTVTTNQSLLIEKMIFACVKSSGKFCYAYSEQEIFLTINTIGIFYQIKMQGFRRKNWTAMEAMVQSFLKVGIKLHAIMLYCVMHFHIIVHPLPVYGIKMTYRASHQNI